MSLTADQITAPGTYLVRCHGKNFAAQVAQVKAIKGKITSSRYDSDRKLWVVTLAPGTFPAAEPNGFVSFSANLNRIEAAIHLGAEVVRDGEPIGQSEEPGEPDPTVSPEFLAAEQRMFAAYGDLSDWEGAPTSKG